MHPITMDAKPMADRKEKKRQMRRHLSLIGREIRRANTIPFQTFCRLVREVLYGEQYKGRLQEDTLMALQKSTEAYVRSLLEDSSKCALHAKRSTLFAGDVLLAQGLSSHPDLIV
jgi:histone H3